MTSNVTRIDKPRRSPKPANGAAGEGRPADQVRDDVVDDAEREARAALAKLDTARPGPGETTQDALRVSAGEGRPVVLYPPMTVPIVLTCPSCGDLATVEAKLSARVTKDSDGSGAIALRTRAPKAAHICGQLALDLGPTPIAEGPRSR